jgi:hypothetical protein
MECGLLSNAIAALHPGNQPMPAVYAQTLENFDFSQRQRQRAVLEQL